MNPSKPKPQPSCDEQRLVLRYDMATILSTLNLRLYIMQQQQVLKDDDSEVLEQCFERLAALLEQWKTLE